MGKRRVLWLALATLLAWVATFQNHFWQVSAAAERPMAAGLSGAPSHLARPSLDGSELRKGERLRPGPSIEAYVRPEFARQMRKLQPAIIAAAERHNRPELSGMSDREFAVVIAVLLYNEHFGWLEEQVKPIRPLTPLYESLQVQANHAGADLSIWPANLRPSVAAEILRQEVPVPEPTMVITQPITVAGSTVDPYSFTDRSALYAAITSEIARPDLAVEYLAANLERGLYRAQFEGVPVTWRVLAAWHNQGVVAPRDIAENSTANSYVRRTSAYLPQARHLVDRPMKCHYLRCEMGDPADFVTSGEPTW